MRKLLGLLILCGFLFSCSKTNEDRVIAAFKEYAEKNLDDPSAITEILGIDSVDTVSTYYIKGKITESYQIFDSTHIECGKYRDAFLKFCKDPSKTSKINKVELNNNPQFKSIMSNYFSLLEKEIGFIEESARYAAKGDSLDVYDMEHEYEGIMNMKDTVYCSMLLSYRAKKGNEVKLHKIDVSCDTLYSSFRFAEPVENHKEYWALVNAYHYFTDKYKRDFVLDLEIMNALRSLNHLLQEKYNVGLDIDEQN